MPRLGSRTGALGAAEVIAVCLSPIGRRQLRHAVDRYIHHADPKEVAPDLIELSEWLATEDFDAIVRQSAPSDGAEIADAAVNDHHSFMSYDEARRELNMARRTMTRRVADGSLAAVGRRITVASVRDYQRGNA